MPRIFEAVCEICFANPCECDPQYEPAPEEQPEARSQAGIEQAIATSLAVAQKATALAITTPEAYTVAGEEIIRLAAERRRRVEFFAPMKSAAHEAHRQICAKEKEALDPLDRATKALESGIRDFRAEQERIRAERQKQIDAEADARMAEEREKKAQELEAMGRTESAARVRASDAIPVARTQVDAAIPAVAGLSFAEGFDFEITDAALVPRELCSPDAKAIRAYIRIYQERSKIPGVRVFAVERSRKRAKAG